jgi:predicted metal-dependent RNase
MPRLRRGSSRCADLRRPRLDSGHGTALRGLDTRAMRLTFLGGVGTTGSKYLLEHGGHRLLVDCGLFQDSTSDLLAAIADVVSRSAARGGAVVIPSFAVGCAQMPLYALPVTIHGACAPICADTVEL